MFKSEGSFLVDDEECKKCEQEKEEYKEYVQLIETRKRHKYLDDKYGRQ